MIAKSHQWRYSAVAVAALLGLWGSNAAALSLGRISVQSALGEPLRAEIDVLDINAEESSTLVAKAAAPEVFRAAGLDFHPAMGNLQVSLQRRANGRAYLRLSSDRSINEPFVDMILETQWSAGRIVRDYTMLFDPPSSTSDSRAAPVSAAQLPGTAGSTPAAPVSAPPAVAPPPPPSPTPPVAKPTAKPAPAPVAAADKAPATQTVTVKAGDTASKIASKHKPADVSLDQMLVALLRANPDAFIQENINRIKAGAVLDLPTPQQAGSTPPDQASQLIQAQSQDFNAFRRKFAGNAPSTTVAPASRELAGTVQTTVQDKKPAAAASDKLTLSKGSVSAKAPEAQLAQNANARETANRTAELAKNINELGKIAAASGAATSTAPASAASAAKPALPSIVTAPAAPPSDPASAAVAAPPVSAPASATRAPAVKRPPPPPPEPLPEPSLLDSLLNDNPLLPVAAAGLLALLAGLGLYKLRQRKKLQGESADTTQNERPESLLGTSGGQSVDTSDPVSSGSSMVYSPSQLDAADEVDPVAEADVYLAYGRDLQAEEILKDALRNAPQRLAIHQKLLEIYAKRRDTKAFEAVATQVFNLTDGAGEDWEQICEKGLSIDPDNALYLPGGQPLARPSPLTGPAPFDTVSGPPTIPLAGGNEIKAPLAGVDLDLDLDLDFSDEPPASVKAPTPEPATPPAPEMPEPLPSIAAPEVPETERTLALDLRQQAQPEPASTPDEIAGLDFSLPELPELPPSPAPAPAPAPQTGGMLEFDLGSLSLDVEEEPVTVAGSLTPESQDPLETKLALADEFRAIGDDDGARALIEEVIAEASGDMKARAQRALSQL